ncbi:non-canonical purine NTP pyrophosphatase [candidate division KSB1 bacterium 4484_87]|nr:MAG: non-canonical purine NTP pyrophosphatase [candidate division KSB1 bacterium 4484_87]
MKLILATKNKDKVREMKELLRDLPLEILSAADFPELPDIEEDGDTLEQNAIKKAKTIYEITGIFSLADDTGLEVDALDGQPGVFSSRFSGENATYDDNVAKLLRMMENVPDDERSARFRTVIAIIGDDFQQTTEGICPGVITRERRGDRGFGYDPIFFVPEYDQTFAEMDLELKNKISHRGRALQKAKQILEKYSKQISQ